jgi:3-isopropylmalate dehydrogenase
MMLEYLGYVGEERRLEGIVARAVGEEQCTPDVGGSLGTRAVGDYVVGELERSLASSGSTTT